MSVNESKDQEFLPGDVVSHREWGVGYIVEKVNDAQADLVLEFPGKPRHRMSSRLASHALSKLPENGLEALLLREQDKVIKWSKDAPLKLIGAVLTDLGRTGKPVEIRMKLEGRILPTKWSSWWKRIQPSIKDSAYFLVRSDGSYHLNSTVEQIPESPLPSSPKKIKPSELSSGQLDELVENLEAGKIQFESLKGAKTLSLVAKTLAQRYSTSERARNVIITAMQGPILHTRLILQEFLHLGQPEYPLDVLKKFVDHTQLLVITPVKKDNKSVIKHVTARIRLLENIINQLTKRQQLHLESNDTADLIKTLLQLALVIWRDDTAKWRSQSRDRICSILLAFADKEPNLFIMVGEYLARSKSDISGKLALVDNLFKKSRANLHHDALDNYLTGSLVQPSEFFEECFIRHIEEEQQLSWMSSQIPQILTSGNIHAFESFARLLLRMSHKIQQDNIRQYLSLAITIGVVNSQAQEILHLDIKDKLKQRMDKIVSEKLGFTQISDPKTILDSIEAASYAKVAEERDEARAMRLSLESNIRDLQITIENLTSKSTKLNEMVEQLKSGYRVPEQWAQFQGKKEVLEGLAEMYQETYLTKAIGDDLEVTRWVLQRIENLLKKNGVSKFGQIDSRTSYDSSLHEFIPGSEGMGKEINIKCLGFEWRDPVGNRIILSRAKVVTC